MGVTCRIYLPGDVRVADVADIIAILAGRPMRWRETQDGKTRWVHVDDVTVSSIRDLPQCAEIAIGSSHFGIRKDSIRVLYHFEPSSPNTWKRLLSPPSTAFWIAVGKRLVNFYGGSIDCNDADGSKDDFVTTIRPREDNAPEKGDDWNAFQIAKSEIKPLTQKEIDDAKLYAAHPE